MYIEKYRYICMYIIHVYLYIYVYIYIQVVLYICVAPGIAYSRLVQMKILTMKILLFSEKALLQET